ncbi:MAG: STAS domain-containing protein [Phycisphaerales bacterium]
MKYVKINGPAAVVTVVGAYDFVISTSVKDDLSNALNNGCTKVEVNFEHTSSIDSAAMGDLIQIRRRVGPENFAVKNIQGEVLKSFKGARLTEWLR